MKEHQRRQPHCTTIFKRKRGQKVTRCSGCARDFPSERGCKVHMRTCKEINSPMPSKLYPVSLNFDVEGYPGVTDDESNGPDAKDHDDDAMAEMEYVCVEREYHERLKAIKRAAERDKEQGPVPQPEEPETVLTIQSIDLNQNEIIKHREQDLIEIAIKQIINSACTRFKDTYTMAIQTEKMKWQKKKR